MIKTKAYAALGAKEALGLFEFERRDVGEDDVLIDILYCGICHSDVHQVRDEWGGSTFPMVPGHEIFGTVSKIGTAVSKFKEGDHVGVGCFVDSCRECSACKDGEEQYCEKFSVYTYNAFEKDGKTPTQGGYSTKIVVDQNYILRVPSSIKPEEAAPLLCAGITLYSPLMKFGCEQGKKVGIVGLGGLGHMGVKIAAAMGARVTVFSHTEKKKEDSKRLGAEEFISGLDEKKAENLEGGFDLIIDTVSARHDINLYLNLLRRDGTMILVGVPDGPHEVQAFPLIAGRRRLAGSLIGGIKETQEMLDFCGEHGIGADVEVIQPKQINEAYKRIVNSDVRYRFVIDLADLSGS